MSAGIARGFGFFWLGLAIFGPDEATGKWAAFIAGNIWIALSCLPGLLKEPKP